MLLLYLFIMWIYKSVFILLSAGFFVDAQNSVGNACHHTETNSTGECVILKNCQSALLEVTKQKHPQLCGFNGANPIVCCPKIAPEVTVDRRLIREPGKIADQKCWEYSESVYKQVPSVVALLDRETLNISTCTLVKLTLVIGGEDAKEQEFPHMALVGFGVSNNITWGCGGTLISDQFVLTAAHCINTRHGTAKYIRLGELNLARTDDAAPQDFDVIQMIKHPMYNIPKKYNDIALLKMDRPTIFNEYIRPACLHLTTQIPKNRYIATGWGVTENSSHSDILQKVILENFSYDDCDTSYVKYKRQLPSGILRATQLCAGGKDDKKDTCQGDSGGPLQIYHPTAHCMYSIIGVTSFGKACGTVNIPGVYTRVSNYIEWIEQHVWLN